MRMMLDRNGSVRALIFHALFSMSGQSSTMLMWSWLCPNSICQSSLSFSQIFLMLVVQNPCFLQRMSPVLFLLPLSFHRVIIRHGILRRTAGHHDWLPQNLWFLFNPPFLPISHLTDYGPCYLLSLYPASFYVFAFTLCALVRRSQGGAGLWLLRVRCTLLELKCLSTFKISFTYIQEQTTSQGFP